MILRARHDGARVPGDAALAAALAAEVAERPEAVTYTIPVTGVKIVVCSTPDDEPSGLAFDPERPESIFAWNRGDLSLPPWARTRRTIEALQLVASRVDVDGMAHYSIPNSKLILSARWKDGRFDDGTITDTASKTRQSWIRTGWYSQIDKGPWSYRPNVRRWLNMLCRAMTVGAGGMRTDVPS